MPQHGDYVVLVTIFSFGEAQVLRTFDVVLQNLQLYHIGMCFINHLKTTLSFAGVSITV